MLDDSLNEASNEIATLIANSKKNHGIGESLIKSSIPLVTAVELGKNKANNLSQIVLFCGIVKERIDELSQDIKDQVPT